MNKLKEIRTQQGLSQSLLSKEANVSLRSLQAYEQGDRDLNKAQAETVYKLTNGLITEDQLTEEQKKNLIKESYKPKKVKNPIGIAQQYISTSGNATYSLNICSNADFGAKLSKVGD